MPSWELFRAEAQSYRDEVLPPSITKRLAVEAGIDFGWCEWVGDEGATITMSTFGTSAPGPKAMEHYGFTVEDIVEKAAGLAKG
jgi:transketolase